MCRLRNIAMRDYQESVTIGQTDTRTHRQTPDKVITMCRYASQATQKRRLTRPCTSLHRRYTDQGSGIPALGRGISTPFTECKSPTSEGSKHYFLCFNYLCL